MKGREQIGRMILALALSVNASAALAQTRIEPHRNKYTPEQDVQIGRQAAAEVEQKMPVLRDAELTNYVQRVGQRLASAIPQQFQHPAFNYTFRVISGKEINAFALPGGPMYLNTGMIAAARNEGEMAGVMAHEISHVALRHATAQATKGEGARTLGALGQIAGAILGGVAGGAIATGAQIGSGLTLLKYSREYETEADILGAQILARAGYNPRDLANVFRTIQEQGSGSGGPEWISSHPNPENRYQRIEQEAQMLRVSGPSPESAEFRRMQARIGSGSMIASERDPGTGRPSYGGTIGRVEPPSMRLRTFSGSDLFQVSVPENWREVPGQNDIWFAPEGGYGEAQGQPVFTHGVNVGVAQTQTQDLQRATEELIQSLAQGNNNLRQRSASRQTRIDGRTALFTSLTNISEATGAQENVDIYTVQTRNGELLYLISVAPQNEYRSYQRVFDSIARSLRFNQ